MAFANDCGSRPRPYGKEYFKKDKGNEEKK
jgi:hypothetical protein